MDEDLFPVTAAPLGWMFGALVRARRSLRGGRGADAGVPVISIGNLRVGGTGKTPLAREVARWLGAAGLHAAILSRGYGRPRETPGTLRVSRQGRLEAFSWEMTGDEPWMLARTLPAASVYVSASRTEAGAMARADGAEVLVLDDGFQHLRLNRALDIVCLAGDEVHARTLPAGPLREPVSALHAAGAAVWITTGEAPLGRADAADARALRGRLAPGATWAEAVVEPDRLSHPDGREASPGSLAGERVGLLCGIAGHERFVRTVRGLGARVEALHSRRDHHWFTEEELSNLRTDILWVTTEKDAVRLAGRFPVAVLTIALRFTAGGDELRARVLAAARPRAGGAR